MNATKIDIIHKRQQALVKSVRAYTESQKRLWQQVPWLAIEAMGRGGWRDNDHLAYYGLWQIAWNHGVHSLCIECSTGQLYQGLHPATNKEIIVASLSGLGHLDAQQVITRLKERSKDLYAGGPANYTAYATTIEANKEAHRVLYGVERVYRRHKPLGTDWDTLAKDMELPLLTGG